MKLSLPPNLIVSSLVSPSVNPNVFFFRFLKISPHVWPNWGLWWCFAYFTDNSIIIIRKSIYVFLVYFMWNPPFLQANLCLDQRWHLSCKVPQILYTKGASSPLKIIIAGLFIEAKFYHFFTMSKELEQGCSGNSCLALSFQTEPSLQGPTPGTYGRWSTMGVNHICVLKESIFSTSL